MTVPLKSFLFLYEVFRGGLALVKTSLDGGGLRDPCFWTLGVGLANQLHPVGFAP